MTADLDEVVRARLLSRLDGIQPRGGYLMARCPAHDDHKQSLSVSPGKDQPVILNCHAGCPPDQVLAALGLSWPDLCKPRDEDPDSGEWTPHGQALAVYDYLDEHGALLFQVLRLPDKRFVQRRPDRSARSGWKYQLGDTRRVLYRLPKITEAVAEGGVIYVAEGERDVHSIERAGAVATCNPGGAGKWREEYSRVLADAIVIIVADKDDPGRQHARQVAASLKGRAAAVEIREAAAGKDASDHLAAGKTLAELAITWTDDQPPQGLAADLVEFLMVDDPPLDQLAGGLLERGNRLITTGREGQGKTTLLRQMGTCAAAGLDPFTLEKIKPSRMLMIDFQDRERDIRREFRWLARCAGRAGAPLERSRFFLEIRPRGVDLTTDDGKAWLLERITVHEPDIVFLGPLYWCYRGDLNEEGPAREVVDVLDAVSERGAKGGCALMIEHHSPHGDPRQRPDRPAGSSVLMRWPDAGLSLVPDGKPDEENPQNYRLRRWRGFRNRAQGLLWPDRLYPGIPGGWPWLAEPTHER